MRCMCVEWEGGGGEGSLSKSNQRKTIDIT